MVQNKEFQRLKTGFGLRIEDDVKFYVLKNSDVDHKLLWLGSKDTRLDPAKSFVFEMVQNLSGQKIEVDRYNCHDNKM